MMIPQMSRNQWNPRFMPLLMAMKHVYIPTDTTDRATEVVLRRQQIQAEYRLCLFLSCANFCIVMAFRKNFAKCSEASSRNCVLSIASFF